MSVVVAFQSRHTTLSIHSSHVFSQLWSVNMEDENLPENSGADEGMDLDEGSTSSEDEENGNSSEKGRVYLPGAPIEDGDELVCDESAYRMYHQAQTGAPCLSFDVLSDHLGDNREQYPLTSYLVAGTQAEMAHVNFVITMKMSNLRRTGKDDNDEEDDDDSESDDNDDEDESKNPELVTAMIKHPGTVNRIRSTVMGGTSIAATWSERGKVHIWDLTSSLQAVNDTAAMAEFNKNQNNINAVFTFAGHQVEGYGLDWSPLVPGRLATGDCNKNIHLWQSQEGGTWLVDQRPYSGHTASVEDIQWSPSEENVFASCSVDKSIRIWDARAQPHKACMITAEEAHTRDVNVISWNKKEPFIISGGDDGIIKIWDLRQIQQGKAVAIFKHHTSPISSIEWNFQDSTVFAASGSDDQLTIWDLAVERDQDEAAGQTEEEPSVPPQLLFIHQGQTDLKELHWHPQLPGVIISTAHSGFNIFRTISV